MSTSKRSFRRVHASSERPGYPDREQARRRDVLRLLVGALAAGSLPVLTALTAGCEGATEHPPVVDMGGPSPDGGGLDQFSDGYLRDLQAAVEGGGDAGAAGDGAADGPRH